MTYRLKQPVCESLQSEGKGRAVDRNHSGPYPGFIGLTPVYQPPNGKKSPAR